jgi:hypothetical protein
MRFLFLVLAALVLAALAWRFRPAPRNQSARAAADPDLRTMILRREILAPLEPSSDGRPRVVVMDWTMESGTATLVAFDDGTTSLYMSTGGGVIGAGEHDEVRDAAGRFRTEAERMLNEFAAVAANDPLSLPPSDAVNFYIITDSATLRAGPIATSRLIAGDHPLAELGNRAQVVIAAIQALTP